MRHHSTPVSIVIFAIFAVFLAQKTLGIREAIRPSHDKVVTCYVASWATYRKGDGQFTIDNLRPQYCTHIIYAFAGLNATTSTIYSLDGWGDLEDNHGRGGYKKMTGLKRQYPGLKVSLAIGGWNEGSANYSALAASPQRRSTFVASVVEFLRMFDFDGFDLDWEFPGKRGGAEYDKDNFVHLTRELNQAFKSSGYLLTAAIGAGQSTIDVAYDIKKLSMYLDFIHVMTYDYHGAWDRKVLPNAPMRGRDQLSVEDSINYLLTLGAPANKLLLGLPMYGRTFILSSPMRPSQENPMGLDAQEQGFKGPFTGEAGFMGYNEICRELSSDKTWRMGWDNESSTPYAVLNDQVIAYDDPKSFKIKIDFANKMGLAGAMIWSIDTDDFKANCTELHNDFLDPLTGSDFPMMRAVNMALERKDDNNEINIITTQIVSSACLLHISGILILSSILIQF